MTLASGCGKTPAPGLRLYCGAGLRPPMDEIVRKFAEQTGIRVEPDYAGSEVLLARVKTTGQGDLFMPADNYYLDLAAQEGLVAKRATACRLLPVILVAKGNPKGIHELADLLRGDVKLGLGDANACAVGRTSVEVFAKAKIDFKAVSARVAVWPLTVNELANHVKLGTLDAAVVWDAVAAMYPQQTEAVALPESVQVAATVPIAVLKCSNQQAQAERFLEYVTSPEAAVVFERHHYAAAEK